MKRLIIILLYFLLGAILRLGINAQIAEDKQAHFAAGFFISVVGTIESYEILKDTQMFAT